MRQRICGAGSSILRRVADAMKRSRSSWCRGPDPGLWRGRSARWRGALADLDDDHAPAATRAGRAMVCRGAGGLIGVVVLGRRIWRQRHGNQLPGARDVGLAAGAGEQPVVSDAVKPLGQDVEQEAPDELVRRKRHRAIPCLPVSAVSLAGEGDAAQWKVTPRASRASRRLFAMATRWV